MTAVKAFQTVLAHVEQGILDGSLQVGSLLPAERDLAAQLGVSRTAVREAIRALEAQGLVTASVGAGGAGGTRIAGDHGSALAQMLRLHVALGQVPVPDAIEVRVVIERESARRVARRPVTGRGDTEELAHLLGALERMRDDQLDLAGFNELDTAFHGAIAEQAGNKLAADLTIAMRESISRPIRTAARRGTEWQAYRTEVLAQHLAIVEAITARDAEAAADCAEEHIRWRWGTVLDLRPHGTD